MKVVDQLNTLTDTIDWVLDMYPITRDNDCLLWLAVMNIKYDLKQILKDQYEPFKALLLQERVPSFESVSRCRRKLQEKNKSLRGELYEERQNEAKEVCEWSKQALQ